MKKILASAAGLSLVAVAPLATLASADAAPAKAAKVSVSIEGNPDPFGELSSSRPTCIDNRLVVLYKQVGKRGGGNDRPTGNTDRSDDDGSFDFGSPGLETGKYYAVVGAKNKKGKVVCKAGASPTIQITRS